MSCNKTQHAEIDAVINVINLNTLKIQNPIDKEDYGVFDSCRLVRLEATDNSQLGNIENSHN